MANLIKPDKNKHEYIIGIDFGHGETSAAIFKIEWDKEAGLRDEKAEDIDLDIAARKKVIPSAICRVKDGCLIGDEAFEHMTDNNGIRLGFKQKPQSLDGDAEQLMMDYMHAVYARIRESRTELTDTNHIVYIARPSGWIEEDAKELYRQMAIKAGLPLGGLTSESRAAIFYAKSPSIGFARDISNGAIVFDLGSSTLDFTWLANGSEPVDYGYNLGASIIDNDIYENMILSHPEVKGFIAKYPEYKGALLFRARKFKEEAYSRNPNSKTIGGFPLGNIISEDETSYDDYADVYVKLRINNLQELNDRLENDTRYISRLKEALLDFKENHIPGKTVNGVFLTGGASRMNFIIPLIAEAYNMPVDKVKIDSDNPSLTISRGIAMLGAADAITAILVEKLNQEKPSLIKSAIKNDNFINTLSYQLSTEAWKNVEDTCHNWEKNGKTTDMDELKQWLETAIKDFQTKKVPTVIKDVLKGSLQDTSSQIRKKMNEIISNYAPGQEIKKTATLELDELGDVNDSLRGMSESIDEICDSIYHIVGDILWMVFAAVMFGIFAIPYYIAKYLIMGARSDESKRKDKTKRILKKKDDLIGEMQLKILVQLSGNAQFEEAIGSALDKYYTKLIDSNIKQVQIPIE